MQQAWEVGEPIRARSKPKHTLLTPALGHFWLQAVLKAMEVLLTQSSRCAGGRVGREGGVGRATQGPMHAFAVQALTELSISMHALHNCFPMQRHQWGGSGALQHCRVRNGHPVQHPHSTAGEHPA